MIKIGLQKQHLNCVFCDRSNQKHAGGYFKGRFLCAECDVGLRIIDSYLKD